MVQLRIYVGIDNTKHRLQTYKAMGDYSHLKYRMPTGNVSYSDFITESYNVEFMTMCIVFIFLGSFGMFLNGKKICQFFQSKTVKNRFNIVVFNILLSDFMVSSIGIFMDIIVMSPGANRQKWKLGEDFCHLEGFFYMTAGMSSLYSTTVLAIVRLIAIKTKDNTWFEASETSLRSACLILTIWLLAITFSAPPLLGFGQYDQSLLGVSCLPAWSKDSYIEIAYTWYVWVAGALIPSTMILTSNGLIIDELHKNHREFSTIPTQLNKKCQKRETLLMTFAFFICWGPLGVVYCAPLLTDTMDTTTPNILPLLTVKFGCAIINPLVYAFENHGFFREDGAPTFELRIRHVKVDDQKVRIRNQTDVKAIHRRDTI